MIILDGRVVKNKFLLKFKKQISLFKKKHNCVPQLAIIQVGNDPSSNIYIRNKIIFAKKIGCAINLKKFNNDINTKTLVQYIKKLNTNKSINGILIQMPLPKHIDEAIILESISCDKDVDCFNPFNIGKL